jgi:hypothetical protein
LALPVFIAAGYFSALRHVNVSGNFMTVDFYAIGECHVC